MGRFPREIATSQVLPMQQNRIRTFLSPSGTYGHFTPSLCERTHAFTSQLNQTLGTVYYRAWNRPFSIAPSLVADHIEPASYSPRQGIITTCGVV